VANSIRSQEVPGSLQHNTPRIQIQWIVSVVLGSQPNFSLDTSLLFSLFAQTNIWQILFCFYFSLVCCAYRFMFRALWDGRKSLLTFHIFSRMIWERNSNIVDVEMKRCCREWKCQSAKMCSLKGDSTQKLKFCHHLLTLKLLQTWMSLFLLLNTKHFKEWLELWPHWLP